MVRLLVLRLIRGIGLVGLLALAPLAWPALASDDPYEVWVIDQADVDKGGARLYIYQGQELEGPRYDRSPEVVDLMSAAVGVGDGPGVRPHLLAFNQSHTHGLIAHVTSGHVYVIRAADRSVVASIDVGAQAHGALAAPDDSFILVANQNGKKLARIWADFVSESFRYDPAEDLDLGALEDAEHPDNAPICPILFAPGGYKAYVTLRGGGLYVVDAGATPMAILRDYGKSQVAPAGCGGLAVGDKMYINSGTASTSDLYVFDGRTDELLAHLPFTPLGARDGHGMALLGQYLWMGNRASGDIVVVDTATDTHVGTITGVGKAPDIMDISPSGSHLFVVLRGPNNLTGGPPAKGETPGFVVFQVGDDGASGARALFVPIGSQAPDSPSDPHALAVRRAG